MSSCLQVTRLCRTHQLHSALAFLFTRALSDYAAPAAELLLAHAHGLQDSRAEPEGGSPGGWDGRTPTGYKLLVYLRCGLNGEAFPPGALFPIGRSSAGRCAACIQYLAGECIAVDCLVSQVCRAWSGAGMCICLGAGTGEIPADIQATVKLQLLAFLLFSTLESAHRLAAAFGGSDGDYSTDESAEALLPGPHAALRCLIRLDAGKTRSPHSLHALMSRCLEFNGAAAPSRNLGGAPGSSDVSITDMAEVTGIFVGRMMPAWPGRRFLKPQSRKARLRGCSHVCRCNTEDPQGGTGPVGRHRV